MKPFLALPKIVLFYAFLQVLSPFTRSSKRPLRYVAFIHEIGCQKNRRNVSSPRTPRLAVGIILLSFLIYCSIRGVQQQATRVSPQTADLYFLRPRHMTTRHLSEILLQAKRRKEAKDFNRQALYSQ